MRIAGYSSKCFHMCCVGRGKRNGGDGAPLKTKFMHAGIEGVMSLGVAW